MDDFSKYDKNFHIQTSISKEGKCFYNVLSKPFEIDGLLYEQEGFFARMPQAVANTVSEGVANQNRHTTGGRVRFKTDSASISICAKMFGVLLGEHIPVVATAGFDLYEKVNGTYQFYRTFVPRFEVLENGGYESEVAFPDKKTREVLIHFPIGSCVSQLFIGLDEDATVENPEPYSYEKPIVFYGSSITKGFCASRPGNTYENMISRKLNCDYINLGFAGCAKGEQEIAEYIAALNMCVFVYDYDYNAPDVEHLSRTHKPMFDIIRKKNPYLPIIMLSRPNTEERADRTARFEVVRATFNQAVAEGDKNVYLIDGRRIMPAIAGGDGTVDGVHPNDLGFYCLARAIGNVLEDIFNINY